MIRVGLPDAGHDDAGHAGSAIVSVQAKGIAGVVRAGLAAGLTPLLPWRPDPGLAGLAGTTAPGAGDRTQGGPVVSDAAARTRATVVRGAAAPFAATAHARARLLRQLHASGLLATREPRPARSRGPDALGAPR